MKPYKSKVVTINAMQFLGDPSIHEAISVLPEGEFIDSPMPELKLPPTPFYVKTREGKEAIWPTDWLMQGLEGEFYPCKDTVFQRKYEDQ